MTGLVTVDRTQSQASASHASSASNVQARLILQDSSAFEQATQPALRSSLELVSEPTTLMEREKAREQWENLSLEPEVAQERQAERKRLLLRADQLARDAVTAKAQSAALEAQLARAKEDRLNHPVVYAGALGLVALGGLWWLERRKRLRLQDKELEQWGELSSVPPSSKKSERFHHEDANSHLKDIPSVFFLEEPSDSAQKAVQEFNTSTNRPTHVDKPQWAQSKEEMNSGAVLSSSNHSEAMTSGLSPQGFFYKIKRIVSQLWKPQSQRNSRNSSNYLTNDLGSLHTENFEFSTIMHADSAQSTSFSQERDESVASKSPDLSQQSKPVSLIIQNEDQENIDLLSKIQAKPSQGESAMEHLLDLRMAVNGLCALGRPRAAIDLLQAHIDDNAQTCAWAYLESMKICEQINERDTFELIRKRYRHQFNRMAPYWFEPNANVIGLDGYARATGELCAAWSQGYQHAGEVIASWLTGPQLGRKLVQLPAYHDLFDIYEMLEFLGQASRTETLSSASRETLEAVQNQSNQLIRTQVLETNETVFDFVPTVNLLDLDYEFSSDVTLQQGEVDQSEKAVTIVKPGNFSVDFNVAGTQLSGLFSRPAELEKK